MESDNVFAGVSRAYSALTKNPLALALFVISVLSIIAESNGQDGPLEMMAAALKQFIDNPSALPILKTLASFVLALVNFVIKFKSIILPLLLVLVIPLSYPDRDTFLFSSILALYLIISNHSYVIVILITQLVFIYYSLNRFLEKLIVVIAIVYLAIGNDKLNLMFTSK